jgi:hypothetical protein
MRAGFRLNSKNISARGSRAQPVGVGEYQKQDFWHFQIVLMGMRRIEE